MVGPASGLTTRADGNNVDIDREMTTLAETQIQYSAMTYLMARKVAGLRKAISEGRHVAFCPVDGQPQGRIGCFVPSATSNCEWVTAPAWR